MHISVISDITVKPYIPVSRDILSIRKRWREVSETVTIKRTTKTRSTRAYYGLPVAAFGTLLVLSDGVATLVMDSVRTPAVGGVVSVGWGEIILSILALTAMYFYNGHPTGVASSVGITALASYAVGGGFYYFGATVALIGAILIFYRR